MVVVKVVVRVADWVAEGLEEEQAASAGWVVAAKVQAAVCLVVHQM